jgi:hypothetical protein
MLQLMKKLYAGSGEAAKVSSAQPMAEASGTMERPAGAAVVPEGPHSLGKASEHVVSCDCKYRERLATRLGLTGSNEALFG